jgi:hypothetical protein
MTNSGRLIVHNVRIMEKVADIGAKPLSGPVFNRLLLMLGLVLASNASGDTVWGAAHDG